MNSSHSLHQVKPRQKKVFWGMVLLLYLYGCTTGTPIPTKPTETETPSPIPTGTVELSTRTPPTTPEPTVTPTLPGVPGNIQAENVTVRCMEPAPELGKDAVVSGFLMLRPFGMPKPYLLNPKTMAIQELAGDEDGFVEIAVSPQREKFVAMHVMKELNSERYEFNSLVVMQSDGKVLKTIPIRDSWDGAEWLNEEQLIFRLTRYYPGTEDMIEPPAHLMLDLSSGGIKKLEPTFPFIYNLYSNPSWGYSGLTRYDPALSRVVYAKLVQDPWETAYVLWNLQTQQPILEIPSETLYSAPQWTLDGTKFTVVTNLENGVEFLVVTKDGVIETRMTLSDVIPGFSPFSYSWSPDGRSVALWYFYDTEEDLVKEERLAIWDTHTGKVTLLCVTGARVDVRTSPEPIWSPDGNYLLLENWIVSLTSVFSTR